MARPRKRLEDQKRNNTKKEIEERQFQEENSKVIRTLETPPWLNERAKEFFLKTKFLLDEIEVLDDLDIPVLATYCDTYIRIQDLTKELDEQGYILYKKTKETIIPIPNPNVAILKNLHKSLLDCASKLGLNSIDRTKLIQFLPKDKEDDPFEKFI